MAIRAGMVIRSCLALALAGCAGSTDAPAPTSETDAEETPAAFSGNTAWTHLEALAELGPRETGSDGGRAARAYLEEQLDALGLETFVQAVPAERADGSTATFHNLVAEVPGASSDLFLVAAPYDTRGFSGFQNLGVNDGGSGPAVLLELARLAQREPLPYTLWFVFLDGEQEPRDGATSEHYGTRGLVGLLRERDAFEQVRLALVVNRVCDPDLRIARDLGSHRVYRDEFFRVARERGYGDAFDASAPFEAPEEGQEHLTFAGLSRVVVLADTSFGGDEPPGPYANSEDDDLEHCAAASLDTVGEVANRGLRAIARRLERIDRFARSPIAESKAMSLSDFVTDAATQDAAEVQPPETPEAPAAEPTAVREASETPASPSGAEASEAQPAPEATDAPTESEAAETPAEPGADDVPTDTEAAQTPAEAGAEDAPTETEAAEAP